MNRSFRGNSNGLVSGAIASTALVATLHDGLWSLLLGSAIGVAYCGALRPTRRAYADNLMAGEYFETFVRFANPILVKASVFFVSVRPLSESHCRRDAGVERPSEGGPVHEEV